MSFEATSQGDSLEPQGGEEEQVPPPPQGDAHPSSIYLRYLTSVSDFAWKQRGRRKGKGELTKIQSWKTNQETTKNACLISGKRVEHTLG